MKKIAFTLIFLLPAFISFSQSNNKLSDEEKSMKYVKNFHEKLEKVNIDTKKELLWKYTYADTSKTKLEKLAKVFEKENLKIMKIVPSKTEKGFYELTVFEKKLYKTPKPLNERVLYLNSVAKILKIYYDEAQLSASKPDKTEYIDNYQPVGTVPDDKK